MTKAFGSRGIRLYLKIQIYWLITKYPAFLLFSNPFLQILSVQSPYGVTTSLLPYHCFSWVDDMSQGHKENSNPLLFALLGMLTISTCSLLECWALPLHINQMFRFITAFSDSSWLNLSFNLRISWSIKSFFSVSFL